ncbi:MAG: bifunctional isocitrate dehydrogenase kinase/phosphatase [Gaiellales bacterium]
MDGAGRNGTELVRKIAVAIVEGFDRHYRLFRGTSAEAKRRFERAEWAEVQRAVSSRIPFYNARVGECVERLHDEFAAETLDDATWQQVKLDYIGLLVDHKQPELAETFFNSVITRILHRTYVHNDFIFVRAAVSTEYIESDPPNYRSYYPSGPGLRFTLIRLFTDFGWSRPFTDLPRDVDNVMRALLEHLGGEWPEAEPNLQIQVLSSPFYRNKAAYVVGKVVNGNRETPFIVCVLHDGEDGLLLDAILLDPDAISLLFSLSRAYFMVDMDVPSGYVHFLQSLMPAKPRSELYTALGLGGQGKTLFYRDLLHHLHHSQDSFVEAPGTRGLVMHVFNLPSYPYVFKVIKDEFGPSKHTDRETVMRKFKLVQGVDRVGRMVDALEFTHLALPLARFAPELLDQLGQLAPSTIEVDGDDLIVGHCYVERRLTPLNIFLDGATPGQVERAVRDYGEAIRELAIANVFPGDMLWRNFGVNRHGRVVFYDYDEIEYLTDCNFRAIPPPPNPEAEMADEPWYPVGPFDVFPEEFEAFLLGDPRVREVFLRHHAELLQPAFWQECQRRLADGEIVDFFPYPEAARFCNRFPDAQLPAAAAR